MHKSVTGKIKSFYEFDLIFVVMKSVFSTNPPSFTKDETSILLKNKFNIEGDLRELYSDRDQIFFVDNFDGKFIFKVSNASEDFEVIDLQDKAANHIHAKDPRMNIPLRIGSIHQVEKDNTLFYIRLLRYVDGVLMSEKDLDDEICMKMGLYLGRLSNNLKDFDHPGAHRVFDWDVRQISLIAKKVNHIKSTHDKNTIHHFIDQFENHIKPISHKLNKKVIHNDGNDHNIILDMESNPVGVIDCGDMVYSYQSAEPAVCMAYVALRANDVLHSISIVLRHYNSVYKLNKFELQAVVYLMCLRLCITVLMASWRKKLFPDNQYLSISEASAWKLLRMLEKQQLADWSEQLQEDAY